MTKAILILVVGVTLLSCAGMNPINNYPDAIVCDKIDSKWGLAVMIKYIDQKSGRWVYKKLWLTEYEWRNCQTGQPYTKN